MIKKRILITGVCGLLGQNLVRVLRNDYDIVGVDILPAPSFLEGLFDYKVLDISDKAMVKSQIPGLKPDVIINTAAITNVDGCEKERDKADLINHKAVQYLLGAIENDNRFIQISTDYVFDGKNGPYTDEAKPNPLSFYGLTKLRAEDAARTKSANHLIVRTMVLFGTGINLRPDFITWVRKSLEESKEITVVTDQIGNITLASNLAFNIRVAMEHNIKGVISLSGKDILSRFDIAVEIARFYGLNESLIKPTLTSNLKQAAPRPLNSGFVLNRAKTVPGIKLIDFREQLKVYDDEQKGINRSADL